AEENRLRAHDFAGGFALGRPNPGGFIQRFAGDAALAAREINDGQRMAEFRVTRQRSGATRLGVVRMPAHTNDLELARSARLAFTPALYPREREKRARTSE